MIGFLLPRAARAFVRRWLPALILAPLVPLAPTPAFGAVKEFPAVKIFLSDPGIYRVAYEDLVAAGWPAEAVPSSRLAMRRGGNVVLQHTCAAPGQCD